MRDHPKHKLLFFVTQDVNDATRAMVHDFVLRITSLREWLNGPPRFVDEPDEPADTSHGDVPFDTVGGYLEIYSARAPWKLPREIDRQHLDEVIALITALRDFSGQQNLPFEFELDGEFVGSITDGKLDRCLSEGLIGEWKRQLGE